jgi:transcriptional regulator with XRE-family HTH domain
VDKLEIIYRISALRTKAKLSARALSVAVDMNESYINGLESGKNFLPMDKNKDLIEMLKNATPQKIEAVKSILKI